MDVEKFIDKGWEPIKCSANRCEYCGKKKKTTSTRFVGNYCADCHQINIDEAAEAIKRIESEL